jgi:hypothetical protein
MLVIYFGAAKNSKEYKSGHGDGISRIITPFCLLCNGDKLYQSAHGRFRSTVKAISMMGNKRCHSKEICTPGFMAEKYEIQEAMRQTNCTPLSLIWLF